MKKTILIVVSLVTSMRLLSVTIDECLSKAEANYPLVKKYALLEQTSAIDVDNIGKEWFPQITLSAQATLQNRVLTLPGTLNTIFAAQGLDMKGLRKDQYKVGVDVTQTIYDGGVIGERKKAAMAQAEVDKAETDVSLYAVRQRVVDLYFTVLMIDNNVSQINDMVSLLKSSEDKLQSMARHGTAAESDYQGVKAERIGTEQKLAELESQRRQVMMLLSAFCGEEVVKVEMPAEPNIATDNKRPELRLIDSRLRQIDASERLLNTAYRPRLALFATGYYGYPGFDMYDDMFHHKWTLNGMIGAKLTWNISALFTRKNDKLRLKVQRSILENSRDVFLFNNRLEQIGEDEQAMRYETLMKSDKEIVELRTSVRKAAESKLAHGIIDVNDLLKEINGENAAKIQLASHRIERLKCLWDKKITTNN